MHVTVTLNAGAGEAHDGSTHRFPPAVAHGYLRRGWGKIPTGDANSQRAYEDFVKWLDTPPAPPPGRVTVVLTNGSRLKCAPSGAHRYLDRGYGRIPLDDPDSIEAYQRFLAAEPPGPATDVPTERDDGTETTTEQPPAKKKASRRRKKQ